MVRTDRFTRECTVSESSYLTEAARTKPQLIDVPEIPTVVVTAQNYPLADMAKLFDSSFGVIFGALRERGIAPVGPAFSLHQRMPDDTADLEIGVPVDSALTAASTDSGGSAVASTLPARRVAVVSHLGSYDRLGQAWGEHMEWLAGQGLEPGLPFWEVYVTEPSPEADPESMRTDLYVPVA